MNRASRAKAAGERRAGPADRGRPARRPAARAPGPAFPPRAWLSWAALAVIGVLAVAFAWREETSLDLGFHVATGRWILQHHAWPQLDPFTYTVADHRYIDMHGLFQVVMGLGHRVAGMAGVGALRVAFVLAALLIVWGTARRRGVTSPDVVLVGLGLGVCAWEFRFLARPELATGVLLAAQLHLLQRHAEDGRARWLHATVPLQWLWVLSHALSLFGIAVLGLYALSNLVAGDPARRRDRAPWSTLAAATAVMFLNPYGLEGVRFLWDLRTRIESGNVFGESIGELVPVFSPSAAGYLPLTAFRVFLVATPLLMLLARRRMRAFDWAIVLLFGWLATSRVRNLGLFVVAVLPIWLAAAESVAARLSRGAGAIVARRVVAATAAVACALVIALVLSGHWYAVDQRPARFGFRESAAVYPVGTVRTLRSTGLAGPIYNDMGFGGYLELHLWPREKVFIDARLEVIGDEFYRRYAAIQQGSGWDAMMREYGPNLALVAYASMDLTRRLGADSAWALLDADGVAALFARRTTANQPAIAAAEERWRQLDEPLAADEAALVPRPLPRWPWRLFQPRRFDFASWGRGNTMMILGRPRAARREYANAIQRSAAHEPVLAKNYALINRMLGRGAEAATWTRRWQELAPNDPAARAN